MVIFMGMCCCLRLFLMQIFVRHRFHSPASKKKKKKKKKKKIKRRSGKGEWLEPEMSSYHWLYC
ncbi:unnamed protein product [Arabidopsis halleri]